MHLRVYQEPPMMSGTQREFHKHFLHCQYWCKGGQSEVARERASLKLFNGPCEPHTWTELWLQRGTLNPKEIGILRLPMEGITFTTSRHNLMPNQWSVMVGNVPQPDRQKENCKESIYGYKQFFFIPHLGPEACDLASIFHLWLFVSDNKTVPLK